MLIRNTISICIGFILCISIGNSSAADFGFEAGYFLEHNSNIRYSATNAQEDTVHRAYVAARVLETGPIFESKTDAKITHFSYANDSYPSDNVTTLETLNTLWLIPRRLNFEIDDHLAYVPIDPAGLLVPTNQQQINLLSIGPSLAINLTSVDALETSYRYEKYSEDVTTADNKRDVGVARYIHHFSPNNEVGLNYEYRNTNFNNEIYQDHNRNDWYLSYLLRYGADQYLLQAGRTKVNYHGSLNTSGNRYQINLLHQINHIHSLRFIYRNELSDVSQELGYTQQVTATQPLVINNLTVSNTGDVFKVEAARLEYLAADSSGVFRLSISDETSKYTLQTINDQKQTTYAADYTLQISDTTSIGVSYINLDRTLIASSRNDQTATGRVTLNYRLSQSIFFSGFISRLKNSSNAPLFDYSDRIYGIGLTYQTERMRSLQVTRYPMIGN